MNSYWLNKPRDVESVIASCCVGCFWLGRTGSSNPPLQFHTAWKKEVSTSYVDTLLSAYLTREKKRKFTVLPREEEQKKSRQLKFFPKRKNKALKSSFYYNPPTSGDSVNREFPFCFKQAKGSQKQGIKTDKFPFKEQTLHSTYQHVYRTQKLSQQCWRRQSSRPLHP